MVFLEGEGEGERKLQITFRMVCFSDGRRESPNNPFYVIHYILTSGGFHWIMCQTITNGELPILEDSEGTVVSRSVTDSVEYWVSQWCLIHM